MNKLLLIDGNSIMNRAFYGIPDMTTNDGRHTNAIYGFLNIILKVIEEEQATHICVAFDLKKKTFRHEMYERTRERERVCRRNCMSRCRESRRSCRQCTSESWNRKALRRMI